MTSSTATQSPVESRYQQQAVGQLEQHEGADRGLRGKLEACSAVGARGGPYRVTGHDAGHQRPPIVVSLTQFFPLARARARRGGGRPVPSILPSGHRRGTLIRVLPVDNSGQSQAIRTEE